MAEFYVMKKSCGCVDGATMIRNGRVSSQMSRVIADYLRDGGSVERIEADSVDIPRECNHLILK